MPTTSPPVVSYLMDMDGLIVREEQPIPGADRFLARLQDTGHSFLVLTNNSMYTPRDLSARLAEFGLQVHPTPSGRRRWRRHSSCPGSCRRAALSASARPGPSASRRSPGRSA